MKFRSAAHKASKKAKPAKAWLTREETMLYLLDQSIQLAMLAGFDKAAYCALVARKWEASIEAEAQYREDRSSYNRGLGV